WGIRLLMSIKRGHFVRLAAAASAGGLAACGGGGSAPAAPAPSATPIPTPSPSPATVPATFTITQSPVTGSATLDASFASLSYEKYRINTAPAIYFGPGNTNLIGLLNALGGGMLRIGANNVDRITWTPAGAGQTTGQVAQIDVQNFAAFCAQCPTWKVIYGVNYAGSNGSTASPSLAAAEATFAAAQLGSQLLWFEIGNEADLYGNSNTPQLAGITYNTFVNGGTLTSGATIPGWNQFEAAMKTAVPSAAFSGPASASDGKGWAENFAADEQGVISLLTEHYYLPVGGGPSIAAMLAYPNAGIIALLQRLQTASAAHGNVPFRIDECNSYFSSSNPQGVANAFASALWGIDFIFTLAAQGAAGLNFHGGNSVYSPILDDGAGNVIAVQPLYYALYFFSRIFAGGNSGRLLNSTLSAAGVAISAFAVSVGSATYVVLNNKDTTSAANVTINIGKAATQATVTVLASSGATPTAQLANLGVYNGGTAITYGGAAVGLSGSWNGTTQGTQSFSGQSVVINVQAASAALITIT
ncbi:MAG TPA: hypothetical protein VGD50_06390, partial [Candidatus Baltobacteraceae bacterium]